MHRLWSFGEQAIDIFAEDGAADESDAVGLAIMVDQHGRGARDVDLFEGVFGRRVDALAKRGVGGEGAELHHLGGGDDRGDDLIDLTVLIPGGLGLKELVGDGVVESQLFRGAGVAGREAGMLVHGKVDVAIDEPDFARVDISAAKVADGRHMEVLATGALEVGEEFNGDGGSG